MEALFAFTLFTRDAKFSRKREKVPRFGNMQSISGTSILTLIIGICIEQRYSYICDSVALSQFQLDNSHLHFFGYLTDKQTLNGELRSWGILKKFKEIFLSLEWYITFLSPWPHFPREYDRTHLQSVLRLMEEGSSHVEMVDLFNGAGPPKSL